MTLAVLALTVALALAAVPSGAAEKPPPVVAPAKPAVPAIPLPEIAERYEAVAVFLRSLDAVLVPGPDVTGIEQRLPAMAERLAERGAATKHTLTSAPSLAALDTLTDGWRPIREELAAWLGALRLRATALEEARDKLSAQRDTWERTREEARKARAPSTVLGRIDSVLASLVMARERVETARGRILTLQDTVAGHASRADEAVASIQTTRGREAGRLFVRDSPALWSPELRGHPWSEVPGRVSEAVREYREGIRRFVHQAGAQLVFQALLLAALAAFLTLARARVQRWPDADASTASILAMLARPIAAALVLTLLASPWIHRQQPSEAWVLVELGTLVPMLLILRGLFGGPLMPGLYALGAFFLLDLVRGRAVVIPLLEYALFMLEMLAAAALSVWLITVRERRLVATYGRSRLVALLALVSRLALAGFTVALIAGAIGNMTLARLVGTGVLSSIYTGFLAYAGWRLLSALVALALRVWPLRTLRMVQHHRALLQGRIVGTLRVVTVLGWLAVTLQYFSALRPLADGVRGALSAEWTRGTLHISVGDVLAFGLTVWATFLLSSFIRFVLTEDVFPRARLDAGVSYAATSLLHYALLFVGFLLAVAALGVDMNRVTVLGGAFGVGLGFGLQNIVSNFVSGLIVLFERPIRVGDVIEVGGVAGTVGRIGIRASTVRTWDGSELIVPNSQLIADKVTNRTPAGHRVALTLPVRVAYATAPDKVIALLTETARAQPGIAAYPEPVGLFTGFGDLGLTFELRAWTGVERSSAVRSELAVSVYAALRGAGMEIPRVPHALDAPEPPPPPQPS